MVDNTFSCTNCACVFPDSEAYLNVAGEVVCLSCCTVRCDKCGSVYFMDEVETFYEHGTCCSGCTSIELTMYERKPKDGNELDPNQ